MSWRDKLQPASYKGVPFKVESSDYEFGRRTELKQFPNNDGPVLQDFGEDASEFTLSAYVLANINNEFDYFPERDAVIAAFKELKSGKLIHPYYGEMEVYPLGRARISESMEEGGIAKIEMRFVRVNEAEQKLILPSSRKQAPNITLESAPTESGDFNALVDNAIISADEDVSDFFGDTFKAARSFVDNLKNSVTNSLQKIQEGIFKVRGGISALVSQATGELSSILVMLDNVIDAPCDLFNDLKNAGRSFSALCGIGSSGAFGGMVGGCSGILRGEVIELDGETVPETLGKSVINEGINIADSLNELSLGFIPSSQLNNIVISIDAIKYSILSSVTQVAIRTNFSNQEELIEYTDLIANSINNFLLRLGAEKDESMYEYIEEDFLDNVLLYSAIEDLRNIFIQSMYAKAATISKLVQFNVPPEIMSILQTSYDRYDVLTREDEIYGMNRLYIRHPGFIPSGGVINILNE